MKIDVIKKEMLKFIDFYGGDLISNGSIKGAKTREELSAIIEQHRNYMEDMLCDANAHLDNFKRKLGLDII